MASGEKKSNQSRPSGKPSPSHTSREEAPDTDAIREAKDRGAELLAKGKLEEALSAFQELVKLAPQEPAHRQKVAEVLQRMGRKPEAIAEYTAAAEAWARTGWLMRAIALCKLILQLDTGHSRTQALLADFYARRANTRPSGDEAPPAAALSTRPTLAPSPGQAPQGQPTSFFSALEREEFLEVLARLERKLFQPGQQIVREGEPGTSMFVIVEGSVEVVRQLDDGQSTTVARMGEGEFFGEMALVTEGPRLAGVVATAPTVLLELSRDRLEEVITHHPSLGEVVQQFFRERLLTNVLRSNPLFAELPEELRQPIKAAFTPLTAKQGEQILTRGQPSQALYLLLRGRCEVFHEHVDGRETPYPKMVEGDVFGEIALLRSRLVTASVRAATPCALLKLEREAFEQLLSQHPQLRQQLELLGSERRERTARLLSGRTVHHGDARV
ncbi:cyclic nucleotide-binding domain-containing protein [Hyalangium sp.]|uniref:cyclic nucleotide-binding domain-containing protein n=1 Tax=Hyalangium sp. TaxID=2028555 RepID=UPI002D507A8E|nr:cyclic nucleotide-binding domain-containing protein [Hyalangium sp.]HYH99685.1 cyclic nucleotide-binding domain-containing protein [Hyalangium sp.]